MSNGKKIRNWNERYGSSDYLFGTEPNDFLRSVAGQIEPASDVLCLADGEGRNGVYLATLGHRVTAIDQSSAGLEKAKQLAVARGVPIQTIEADLARHDLGSGSWDSIVSIFFHIPPEVRDLIYPRIIKALRPGAVLILESYTPEQLTFGTGGPPVADMMLTKKALEKYFAELSIEHLEALEREVIEGSGHTGMASVVQMVARR